MYHIPSPSGDLDQSMVKANLQQIQGLQPQQPQQIVAATSHSFQARQRRGCMQNADSHRIRMQELIKLEGQKHRFR